MGAQLAHQNFSHVGIRHSHCLVASMRGHTHRAGPGSLVKHVTPRDAECTNLQHDARDCVADQRQRCNRTPLAGKWSIQSCQRGAPFPHEPRTDSARRETIRSCMNPVEQQKIECPMCYRKAAPRLRVVASGILSVCPHCLSPYPPERRVQSIVRAPRYKVRLPTDRDAP